MAENLKQYIELLSKEGIYLTTSGYVRDPSKAMLIANTYIDANLKQLELLAAFCTLILKKTKTPHKHLSSYGLKGTFETIVGYVSNGQMIAALIMAGFICKPMKEPRRNINDGSTLCLNADIYCKLVGNDLDRQASNVFKGLFIPRFFSSPT